MRPRESAKQAVWALVFVSVAAGATLPSTHLSCRPAGPRHGGVGGEEGLSAGRSPHCPPYERRNLERCGGSGARVQRPLTHC